MAAARGHESGPAEGETPEVSEGTSELPPVDFATDVAPILFDNCTQCHSPRGVAPFSLRTYEEARERAERIVRATAAGTMPPWLPSDEGPAFVGERGLTSEQIETIARWAEAGAPPGDLSTAPEPPPLPTGWQLGRPDLVVPVPTYTLPADGEDVYRNIVVGIPVDQRRYVTAVELRPADPRLVHHARMMIDTTDSSRALDLEDGELGFDGMGLRSDATNPDGHFLGWTPGKGTLPPLEDLAWPLDPGTDLVVQLHMRPTGREERVETEVGFYFSERPPTQRAALLVLSSIMIDIPAGDPAYRVTNSYELPVGVDLLSIYPHAHYLGKDLRAYATLPSGKTETLLRVPQWDFDWQEEYRYRQPISLPAGTVLTLDFIFDNSSANPHNPADPPVRVVYGSKSTDEMADLIMQVLPHDPSERQMLVEHIAWHYETDDMEYLAAQELAQGRAYLARGDADRAIEHFRETMQYIVDHPGALTGLTQALLVQGEVEAAVLVGERAVQVTSRAQPGPLLALAEAYAAAGDSRAFDTAREALARAEQAGDRLLGDSIRARLDGYRAIRR